MSFLEGTITVAKDGNLTLFADVCEQGVFIGWSNIDGRVYTGMINPHWYHVAIMYDMIKTDAMQNGTYIP